MKYSYLILLLVFLLTGCPPDNDNSCSTQHEYTEEQQDKYQLILQPSQNLYTSFEQITTYYEQTMSCMGMYADGPTIAFKSFSKNYIGGAWAFYIADAGVIWINTDENDSNHQRSCDTDRQALQHEFVHHLLTNNGLEEESHGHGTEFFRLCGLGVNVDL